MPDVIFQSGNTWTSVLTADPWIIEQLSLEASYPTPTAELIERSGGARPGEWNGWIKLLRTPKTKPAYFPTGLVPRLSDICRKYGYTPYCDDLRERPLEGFPEFASEPIVDRPYQLLAVDKAVDIGRGVLDMPPRCHAKGERVLLADGRRVAVEKVRVGDSLLGPDGARREVLEVHSGEDDLYRVRPTKWADPFIVNGSHPLAIKRNVRLWGRFEWRDELIPVAEFFQKTKNWKRRTYLRFAGPVEFPEGTEGEELPVDPYLLGLLLGDGYLKKTPEISSEDSEIQNAALVRGRAMGLLGCYVSYPRDRCPKVVLGNGEMGSKSHTNQLADALRGLGLWGKTSGTKFVPDCYLRAPASARRALLAGLIDTDGHLASGSYFEIVTKSRRLSEGVKFLAGSLGLRASVAEKWIDGQRYFRVNVCGNVASIPTMLPRKQASHTGRNQDGRVSFSVEKIGWGEYVGFTVAGDHLYLDDEFIVQHNSGKTRTMLEIHRRIALKTIWIAPTDRIVDQTRVAIENFMGDYYVMHLVGSKEENVQKAMLRSVVVCTAATAAALPQEFFDTREMLVVDEWHHGASKMYTQNIFPKCDHIYFRYGMTGTHFRSGNDALAMHSLLSNVIHKVSSADLLNLGHLVPTRVVFLPMPEHPKLRGVESTFQTGHGKYGIHQHKGRNQLVTHAAFYLWKSGRKVLILVGTKAQGYAIQKMLTPFLPQPGDGCQFNAVEFVSTDRPRPKQKDIIESYLNDQEVQVLIGTSLLGEGVDLPNVDALVYARGEKAEVSLMQNAYRVCTALPGKSNAIIVDFADRHHRKLKEHSHKRLDVYYQEPTFNVTVLPDASHFVPWLSGQPKDTF